QTVAAMAQSADESLASDALAVPSGAIVAWDEDAPAGDRGIIKVAVVTLDSAKAQWPGRVASPEASDAESPRLAPRAGAGGAVGAYDLETRATGELDVFARDDAQPSEGAGGTIARVTVRGDTVDPSLVLVPDGVGRGAFDVVSGSGQTWLAYADANDRTRLLPL